MGKGIEGGWQLLDIKHTRQELKDRLAKVNTEVGADWDFDKDGVSDEDAKKNLGLIESAEAAYHALLRDEGNLNGETAGIAPGSGNKGVLNVEVIQEITDIWNSYAPNKYKKDKPLIGMFLDDVPTPTEGII